MRNRLRIFRSPLPCTCIIWERVIGLLSGTGGEKVPIRSVRR